MKIRTLLFIIITLVIFFLFYLLTNETRQGQNNFVPPPGFSVVDKLPAMISSTSSVSTKEIIYTNKTLGLTITLPSGINVKNEVAELHKYELGSGEDKQGQEYKYYEINFSDNTKSDTSAHITITAKEIPYKTIAEWLEKDITRGGNFPEDTVKFEQKSMFSENVLFGFDDWYKSQSTPEEKRSSEYIYVIKNDLLYKIELHNFSSEDRDTIWKNMQFINI